MQKLDDKLAELARLEPDWDSYGADTISKMAIASVRTLVLDLLDNGVAFPSIIPICDGGIQLEWHFGGKDLEWEIEADGVSGVALFDVARDGPETVESEFELPFEHREVFEIIVKNFQATD